MALSQRLEVKTVDAQLEYYDTQVTCACTNTGRGEPVRPTPVFCAALLGEGAANTGTAAMGQR